MPFAFNEILGMTHGFFGTLLLLAFSGAMVELLGITKLGSKWLKWTVTAMLVAILVTDLLGLLVYAPYRASDPASARSRLLADPSTAWIHSIGMELKEHIGIYVIPILFAATFLVWHYGERVKEKEVHRAVMLLLIAAFLVTFITFGLGAYITKYAPV